MLIVKSAFIGHLKFDPDSVKCLGDTCKPSYRQKTEATTH